MLKVVYVLLLSVIYIPKALSGPSISVELQAAKSIAHKAVRDELIDSQFNIEVDELLNGLLTVNRPLEIVFGHDDGPLYDGELSRIQIPYAFILETKQRFKDANYAEGGINIKETVSGALLYTVLHEVTHALIDMHELPVTGKEEDAADDLATLLMINLFEDGHELALSAADLFLLEAQELEELEDQDLQSEHSLEEQRYFRVLCQIYGSDPDNYPDLVEDFTEDRADLCLDQHTRINNAWAQLLAPIAHDRARPVLTKQ